MNFMNEKTSKILSNVFGIKESDIHPNLTKSDIGSWDSLKQMDLVATLEKEYDITLGIPEIIRMQSVEAILEVLKEQGVDFDN
jgi:acyl carrier protein